MSAQPPLPSSRLMRVRSEAAARGPPAETEGTDSTNLLFAGALIVVVAGAIVYANRKTIFHGGDKGDDKSDAPAPPPPKPCPHQQNCGVGCKPTGTFCQQGYGISTNSADDCADTKCCGGGSKGFKFLGMGSSSRCKDPNDGHYPCTCNGQLMNSSGVLSHKAADSSCSIM